MLDISRATDLATLFTLATLNADIYWQEDDSGLVTGITRYSSLATGLVRRLVRVTLDSLLVADPQNGTDGAEKSADELSYRAARQARRAFRQVQLTVQLGSDDRRYLLVSGAPQYDADNHFVGYHCLARDVTSERYTDLQQRRFREAMDMSIDMIYLVDREGLCFLDVNNTACEVTGLSREELLNMHPASAMGFSTEELTSRYDHLIKTGSSSLLERRLYFRDGRQMMVEIHSRAININGRWIIIGISRDITSRKATEIRALRLQQM